MNVIDLACWKFTEPQSMRGIAQHCQAECMLLCKLCELQTIVSDLLVGRLCHYRVSEGGVSRSYFDNHNIKDVKAYALGSFLLQGPNSSYYPHGTRNSPGLTSWKNFHNSSNLGSWGGTSHNRKGWQKIQVCSCCTLVQRYPEDFTSLELPKLDLKIQS